MKSQLLIPAAGMGLRLGHAQPKALVSVAGEPMLVRTLRRFEPLGLIGGAVVVVTPGQESLFERALADAFPGIPFALVGGGAERQDSVALGLARLDSDTEIVLIHDAARPFISLAAIEQSIAAAQEFGAATVAIPCTDTILEVDEAQFLSTTPDRRRVWACQTPQTFRVAVIRAAHAAAQRDQAILTDDASLVRRTGAPVKLVPGTPLNFKVTTPTDLALAEAVIERGLA